MSNIWKPSFDEVRHKIEKALRLLYKNDLFLITNTTNKRSITHKLAEYIQILFPEWHVDCEYNRLGQDLSKSIVEQGTSYPDIIIHHRNTKHNLLVIEAKVHSKDKRNKCDKAGEKLDKEKIKAYIEESNYKYLFGLWLCLHKDCTKTKLDWFENKDGVCCGISL